MKPIRRLTAVGVLGGSLLAASAVPAAAAPDAGDRVIVGPNYVEEVVDCAVTIATLLIGIDDPIEP